MFQSVGLIYCSAPVCELSVCRLSPVQPSGAASWEGLLRAMGLPSHCAPEEVLPRLSELLRKGVCMFTHQIQLRLELHYSFLFFFDDQGLLNSI